MGSRSKGPHSPTRRTGTLTYKYNPKQGPPKESKLARRIRRAQMDLKK